MLGVGGQPRDQRYREVASDYFERRRLRPYAKAIHLWAVAG